MGMGIGSSQLDKRVIQIKDVDGSVKGTISITKSKKKKKKRLQYNHRRISSQLILSKTSDSARKVMTKARGEVVSLLRKQYSSDYDERELRNALIHARKMERVTRRKIKHLTEEEKAKQSGSCLIEKEEVSGAQERNGGMTEEKMREMLEEYEELMEELEDENGLEELMKEYMGAVKEDLSPEELRNLQKKHRADELREIMDADMKYVKAMLSKLEKERQESSECGVSLTLEGVEVPVQAAQESPPAVEGGNVDVSV